LDKSYIDKHHIVDRYVQGRLISDELADFEIFMLEHPEIIDEIEYAKGMQNSIAAVEQDLTPNVAPKRRSFLISPYYSAAASILLIVATASSMFFYSRVVNLEQAITVDNSFVLEQVRGNSATSVEYILGSPLTLSVYGDNQSENLYSVELESLDRTFFLKREQLKADANDLVTIVVGEAPDGSYELRLRLASEQNWSATYVFELVGLDPN
jgi:hypothetical protein